MNNKLIQNFTNYKPTKKERNILEVMLDPKHRTKSITAICDLALCTRNVYYTAFAKPEFVELYNKMSMMLVSASVGKVVNAFVKEAERGSYNHGKALLEMAGVYVEKSELQITSKVVHFEGEDDLED